MKRHDALAPLSRDHRRALELAEGLKQGGSAHFRAMLPSTAKERAAHVGRVFADELEPHFQAEEVVLHPATRGRDEALDAVWKRILADHGQLRALRDELTERAMDADLDARLDRFGQLLADHVRYEERELFPRCEAALSPRELQALGFVEAEAKHGKSCPTS
jgi:hemerythrin-like domain-containing protein